MRVRPPSLTAALVAYLSENLHDAHVATRVPTMMPDKMVRVSAGDGSQVNIIEVNPVMVFEAWAATDPAAESLAADVWSLVNDLDEKTIGGVWVAKSDPRVPYPFPDPNYETQDRWQFYCQMVIALDEEAS